MFSLTARKCGLHGAFEGCSTLFINACIWETNNKQHERQDVQIAECYCWVFADLQEAYISLYKHGLPRLIYLNLPFASHKLCLPSQSIRAHL